MTAARDQLHPTILKTRNAIGRETGARVRLPDAPPYSSYSNPILYEKGFGYVFCLSEVLRKVLRAGLELAGGARAQAAPQNRQLHPDA